MNELNGEIIKEKDVFFGSRKRINNFKNGGSLFEKKIGVFDYLFVELKKCLGFSKVIVLFVVELFFKLIVDKLKFLIFGLLSKKMKISVDKLKKIGEDVILFLGKSNFFCFVSELKRKRLNFEKFFLGFFVCIERLIIGKFE